MNLEDFVVRLKIEKDNKTAENNSRKNWSIIEFNIVEEDLDKGKKRKMLNGQKLEQAKKKFKGNYYNCGKVVTSLMIVVLQERTKIKTKARVNQTLWKR